MTPDNIVSLISSIGFPIVCCIYMWHFISSTMKEFTQAINANTQAITALQNRLKGEKGNDS